jgi:hypothetical protein
VVVTLSSDLPVPPKGLGEAGAAFWVAVLDTFELSLAELELLRDVCRLVDEIEELSSLIAEAGYGVAGSMGQPVVHPAVDKRHAAMALKSSLLARLSLPDLNGLPLRSARSEAASRAVRSRWDRQPPRSERGARGSAA